MTKFLRDAKVWVMAVAFIGAAMPAAAQQAVTPGALTPTPADRYVVGQAKPPAAAGNTVVDLTLEQAIDMALEKNLDLKVAKMSPQIVDYQLLSARAAFNPRVTGTYGYSNASQPNNSTILDPTLTKITTQGQTFNSGASQTLPFHGSSYNVSFNNSRSASNSLQQVLNPTFGSNLSASFSMPLLAGFKIDNARTTLKTTAIARSVADVALQATIENTKASVRTAYWNLRQAIEQIEISQRALDLANRLFQDNRIKVEIGTLAPIETVQSESAVAQAEQALLASQVTWQQAEMTLKKLLVSGPDDDLYKNTTTLNPTEMTALTVQRVDIPGAIQSALAQRTDLVQTRKNIESSQLSLEVTKNQTKPALDFTTTYRLTGQGGQRLVAGERTPGGYGDAVAQLGNLVNPTWTMQFNFTYPLGMQQAKAALAQANIRMDQSLTQLKSQELTVSQDVTNAGLAVENSYKQFLAAQKNREAQDRNTEAAATRFSVGMTTNYEVVQAQQTLTTSRLSELRALISYMNAVAEFERVQRVGR